MHDRPVSNPAEARILILAPSHRDAPTVAAILEQAGLAAEICPDIRALCGAVEEGSAGAALLAEEAIHGDEAMDLLLHSLERQPPWSDLPIVLVVAGQRGAGSHNRLIARFQGRGNVMLLERPLRSIALVSAMRSALRARHRQYQVREHLRERERTEAQLRAQEQALRRLAETLEQRVRERTAELEEANRRLVAEMEQRQQVEQALRQAQKMEAIGRLTGGVAHDFNNILMVVLGGLEMLERTTDPNRRDRLMSGIRQAAARGKALTKQLLAFSRRMTLKPEVIDLRSRLEEMGPLLTGALRANIRLHIDLAPDLWPLMVDPAELELAIINIAVNARDAMPDGGTLTITAENVELDGSGESGIAGAFVRIAIRDTGTGIAPDLLERVFDPFFTTKEVGKGTGLGLSQVYGFAKQSGGHVEARSRLGEGTSIMLYLPRSDVAAMPDAAKRATEADARAPAKAHARILLVEDDDDVAALTAEMLRDLGYTVSRAASAAAALGLLERDRAVDLVLSDVIMPGGMNGVELALEVKRRWPNLPVVLTSGYNEVARKVGAFDGLPLLPKPYRLDTLAAALQAARQGSAPAPRP